MKELSFDIYIGNKMIAGQADNIVVAVTPKFFIPKGNCKLDGTLLQNEDSYYFDSLCKAGTFINDWIDLVGDANLIKAIIYLNKKSLQKSLRGQDIIDCIDKIDCANCRSQIRSFDELN